MTQNTTERSEARRPSRLRALIILNGVLIAVLAAVTFGSAATAQNRIRGDYVMVGGGVNGADGSVVYILDTINQEMMVVKYDHNKKILGGVAYTNLANDAATVLRGRN